MTNEIEIKPFNDPFSDHESTDLIKRTFARLKDEFNDKQFGFNSMAFIEKYYLKDRFPYSENDIQTAFDFLVAKEYVLDVDSNFFKINSETLDSLKRKDEIDLARPSRRSGAPEGTFSW